MKIITKPLRRYRALFQCCRQSSLTLTECAAVLHNMITLLYTQLYRLKVVKLCNNKLWPCLKPRQLHGARVWCGQPIITMLISCEFLLEIKFKNIYFLQVLCFKYNSTQNICIIYIPVYGNTVLANNRQVATI